MRQALELLVDARTALTQVLDVDLYRGAFVTFPFCALAAYGYCLLVRLVARSKCGCRVHHATHRVHSSLLVDGMLFHVL